jgi:hypothetical protein
MIYAPSMTSATLTLANLSSTPAAFQAIIIYGKHLFPDDPHPLADGMCGPEYFCNSHPSFLLCQLVYSIQYEYVAGVG